MEMKTIMVNTMEKNAHVAFNIKCAFLILISRWCFESISFIN